MGSDADCAVILCVDVDGTIVNTHAIHRTNAAYAEALGERFASLEDIGNGQFDWPERFLAASSDIADNLFLCTAREADSITSRQAEEWTQLEPAALELLKLKHQLARFPDAHVSTVYDESSVGDGLDYLVQKEDQDTRAGEGSAAGAADDRPRMHESKTTQFEMLIRHFKARHPDKRLLIVYIDDTEVELNRFKTVAKRTEGVGLICWQHKHASYGSTFQLHSTNVRLASPLLEGHIVGTVEEIRQAIPVTSNYEAELKPLYEAEIDRILGMVETYYNKLQRKFFALRVIHLVEHLSITRPQKCELYRLAHEKFSAESPLDGETIANRENGTPDSPPYCRFDETSVWQALIAGTEPKDIEDTNFRYSLGSYRDKGFHIAFSTHPTEEELREAMRTCCDFRDEHRIHCGAMPRLVTPFGFPSPRNNFPPHDTYTPPQELISRKPTIAYDIQLMGECVAEAAEEERSAKDVEAAGGAGAEALAAATTAAGSAGYVPLYPSLLEQEGIPSAAVATAPPAAPPTYVEAMGGGAGTFFEGGAGNDSAEAEEDHGEEDTVQSATASRRLLRPCDFMGARRR